MKKIIMPILCCCLLIGSANGAEPATESKVSKHTVISSAWPVLGGLLTAAAFGVGTYFIIDYVNKKYPNYTDDKKKQIIQILAAVAVGAISGGAVGLILRCWTKGGYFRAACRKIENVENDRLIKKMKELKPGVDVDREFFSSVYPDDGVELYLAGEEWKRMEGELGVVKEYFDAIKTYDKNFKLDEKDKKITDLNNLLDKVKARVFSDKDNYDRARRTQAARYREILKDRERIKLMRDSRKQRVGKKVNINVL